MVVGGRSLGNGVCEEGGVLRLLTRRQIVGSFTGILIHKLRTVGLGVGEGWRLNNAGDVARPALYYSAWVCVRSFISLSEQEHIILNDSIQRGKCIYMQ